MNGKERAAHVSKTFATFATPDGIVDVDVNGQIVRLQKFETIETEYGAAVKVVVGYDPDAEPIIVVNPPLGVWDADHDEPRIDHLGALARAVLRAGAGG